MNYSELKDIIYKLYKEDLVTLDNWAGGMPGTWNLQNSDFESLGNFELVKEKNKYIQNGYDTTDCYVIYYFSYHDIYIKFKGSYSSYSGTYFRDMVEVKPKQVNTTKFKEI